MRHYITAPRAWQLRILLASMDRHCAPYKISVLAWDFDPKEFLAEFYENNPAAGDGCSIGFVTRDEMLAFFPHLAKLPGPPRETINQMDTFRWWMMWRILKDGNGPVTYVDGDQFWFSSPEPVFEEIGNARLAVSPHRFPGVNDGKPGAREDTHRKFGLYNSGFVHIADVDIAEQMAMQVYWRSSSQILPLPNGGQTDFGDQSALERIARVNNAHIIEHPGVNVAPWNAHRHKFTKTHDGKIFVDGRPLVTYHYSGVTRGDDGRVTRRWSPPYALTEEHDRLLYDPYVEEVERWATSR